MAKTLALLAAAAALMACASNKNTSADGGEGRPWQDLGYRQWDGYRDHTATSSGDGQSSVHDGTTGDKSCIEVSGCFDLCLSPEDESCTDDCLNQASAAAKTRAAALATCERNAQSTTCTTACADSTSAACMGCRMEHCMASQLACDSGGKTGALTCAQINECLAECGDEDVVCSGGCIGQGTAAAQQTLYALQLCAIKAGAGTCASTCEGEGDACSTCLQQACASQQSACE